MTAISMRSHAILLYMSIFLMWGSAVGVAIIFRPLLPVDETRYLAVAWDMWLKDNYLVPHLNGAPYSHKPPLFFWLMTLGWHFFGVNDWWPRLIAPLFSLGTVVLTARLARVLWPARIEISKTAPLILLGTLFWSVFSTLTMFDTMVAFFTVAALTTLVTAGRSGRLVGFILAGVMVGFGLLAKGPAILIHYLPVAILAPWWLMQLPNWDQTVIWSWNRWYLGVAVSIIVSICVGMAWAVPAGMAGGEPYREAIFWGQSADRVINSFAHARPFWWYAAILPLLALPWFIWPPVWRQLRSQVNLNDGAQRLCLIWFAAAFLLFSLINGKQAHYLLPELPAFALMAAFALSKNYEEKPIDGLVPGGSLIFFAAALLMIPFSSFTGRVAETIGEADIYWALIIMGAGFCIVFCRPKPLVLCLAITLSVVVIHFAASPIFMSRYNLAPIANQVWMYQRAGKAVANFGKYHGQYHFLGRLTEPISVIGQVSDDEKNYLSKNPDGIVIAYYQSVPVDGPTPLFTYPFRRLTVAFWLAETLIEYPGIADRR